MQEDPRNSSFLQPFTQAAWITFISRIMLSYMKSAFAASFAAMPPTFAAARKTYSGFSSAKNFST